MNSVQRALAVVLVMSAGLAAGFLSYRLQHRAPAQAPASAAVLQTSPEQPDTPAAPVSPAPDRPVPSSIPDLTLPDLAGNPRALRSFSGRPLIINFWATWCAPCRREIPLLRELRQRDRADHLEVVGIAVDFASAVQSYVRATPIDYPLLVGEQQGLAAAQQFGMETVLPFSVFADAQGRIVALKIGELHREEANFILAEMRAIDQGSLELKQAQAEIAERLKQLAVERAKTQQSGG